MANTIQFTFQATDRFSEVAKAVANEIKEVNSRMKEVGQNFQDAGKRINRFGKQVSKKVSAPLAGLGLLSIKTAADFERSMFDVMAFTGATGDDFDSLRNKAMHLGSTMVFTADNAAQAMTNFGIAGLDVNEILSATPDAMKLAAAASLDMDAASTISGRALAVFGENTEELKRVMDMMTFSFTNSKTDLLALSAAIEKSAVPMRLFGSDTLNTMSALVKMAEEGETGSIAGTLLARTMIDLLKPNKEMQKIMKGLNIEWTDSAGRLKDITEIISDLQRIEPGDFVDIFSTRGLRGAGLLIGETGKSIEEIKQGLSDVDGLMEMIAEMRLRGIHGSLARLRSAFADIQIKVIDEEVLVSIADSINSVTKRFTEFSQASPETFQKLRMFVTIGALLGPVIMAIGQMAIFFGLLLKFGGLAVVLKKIAIGFKWIAMALLTNPIVGALAGIATISFIIWKYWDDISLAIDRVTSKIQNSAAYQFITRPVESPAAQGGGLLSPLIERFRGSNSEASLDINVNDPGGSVRNIEIGKHTFDKMKLGMNMVPLE